ncbi:MAG: S8 family serine peptidase [Verrucomicrobiota bacterium JB024]|nr:S8 family serine peptidase [Verrucomicrobiota bacterium JB024]
MKKALSLALAAAFLAASAWIAWSLGRASRAEAVADAGASDAPVSIAAVPREDADVAVNALPTPPLAVDSLYPEPPPGALRGEIALIFETQAEYDQALAWLREHGIDVLDTLPGLNAIRVSTRNPFWERLGASPDRVGYNFPVAPPAPPSADSPYASTYNPGFGNAVLAFLGVEEPEPHWGEGVTVAVLDSGVMRDHVDLEDARVLALSHEARTDSVGHGTAVSSLIVGQEEPMLGLAPGTTILSLPVLDETGRSDTFRVAEAILLAVDQGARIINMSLGAYGDSKILRQAVKYAQDHGVVLVAAAGNDGASQVAYPAAYDGVLAVAAVDALGQPAAFSNYGPQIDIAAPGVGVPVAWTGDQFASVSGTSFSTPLVSAALAMVLQQNPRLSGTEAVRILLDNANEAAIPGKDAYVGDGILNIERILDRNRRGVFDAALAGYTLNPEATTTQVCQVDIAIENRGTEYLSQVQLTVTYDEEKATYPLGALEPGDVIVQPVMVPADLLGQPNGLTIESTVTINGEDSRPDNDSTARTLRLLRED